VPLSAHRGEEQQINPNPIHSILLLRSSRCSLNLEEEPWLSGQRWNLWPEWKPTGEKKPSLQCGERGWLASEWLSVTKGLFHRINEEDATADV